MTTIIGLCVIALCAISIAFIGWIVRKLKLDQEPEIETEYDWDASRVWEKK